MMMMMMMMMMTVSNRQRTSYMCVYDVHRAVCREHVFKDSSLFYRFVDDESTVPDPECDVDLRQCRDEVVDAVAQLSQIAPDVTMRMILRKPYDSRSLLLDVTQPLARTAQVLNGGQGRLATL